jgi:hypothetical protein
MFTEKGSDCILIVRTKSVNNISTYVAGGNSLVRNVHGINYPSYQIYYFVTWKSVREPAYFDESYVASTESSLFLNSNNIVIWIIEKSTKKITDPRMVLQTLKASLQILRD